jgi:uncharacterized membrane protein
LLLAAVLLGVGLGGFVDGIVLHQLLQWHHMLSSVLVPADVVSVKINMFWDGLFHAFTWTVTAAGIGLLWRASRLADALWSGRVLFGGMLMGWGLFNFAEGLIDHQLLGVHHVKPGDGQPAWDMAFLASGLVLLGFGWMLVRQTPSEAPLERAVRPPLPAGSPT